MPMPLSGADSVVSRAFEALLDMGHGRSSVDWITRSSAEGQLFRGELNACKVFSIPMEVRHVRSRIRFLPQFRATLTSWLYSVTKYQMKNHQKEYRQFLAEIGPEAFKRPLVTHRNEITMG